MKAEILAVGTELLLGQIANTNAQFISQKLPMCGIDVISHRVVGDNPQRLKTALQAAFEAVDIVILTGGLGPTYDDLTKETVAAHFGKKLVRDEKSLLKIESYFEKTGRKMTDNNKKQADMPEGCIILDNPNGTAPGCIIEEGGKIAVMLPGPPREMQPMFENLVIPYFKSKTGGAIVSQSLKICGVTGMGESKVESLLGEELTLCPNPTVATYAKPGEVEVRVTAKGDSEQEAKNLLKPTVDRIKLQFADYIFGYGDDTIEEVVVKQLIEKNITVSTCESCTGGLVASAITDIPGSSAIFGSGFVTYANEAKMNLVGVKKETLDAFGAVSEQTAREMARGAREKAGSDIAVSATGIAGPGGGTADKPVGLVYIAIADKNGETVKRLNLTGNRDRIRTMTRKNIFWLIFENIQHKNLRSGGI